MDRSGLSSVIHFAPHREACLRTTLALLLIAVGVGACVPPAYEAVEMSCSDYIGQPISKRIAALGPPQSVFRINATQVGYVFKTKTTAYVGGEPYYTVNYLTGADKHHTPVHKIARICEGVFVVQAAADTIPISERIIVDVLP